MLAKGVIIILCVHAQQTVRDFNKGTTSLGTLQINNSSEREQTCTFEMNILIKVLLDLFVIMREIHECASLHLV